MFQKISDKMKLETKKSKRRRGKEDGGDKKDTIMCWEGACQEQKCVEQSGNGRTNCWGCPIYPHVAISRARSKIT